MPKHDDQDSKDRADKKPDSQPEPAPKPVAAPKLSAGQKLDLTHEKITVDDVDFEIPKSIPAGGSHGEVRTATSLTPLEWLTVARNNRLLYGINLERALSKTGGYEAEHAALVWKVPENDDFVMPEDTSNTDATCVYSSRMVNFTQARIVNLDLTASLPFVGAAADAERAERHASSQGQKTLHMTGKWNYPRARLRLRDCTAIAPQLIAALEDALDRPDEDARFAALRNVFASFGHVVATEVVIGGQMFFQMDQTVNLDVDANVVQNTIKAAISVETKKGGGGGGVGFDVGNGKQVEAQDIARSIKWQCIGGDFAGLAHPNEWPETVKDPNHWSVIERDGVDALTDRLDSERPDLAKRVRATWESQLSRAWAGHTPPPGYVLPPFGGEAFTMSLDGATSAPTVSAASRKPMTRQMFETLPGKWGDDNTRVAAVRQVVGKISDLKPYLDELDHSGAQPGFGRLVVDTQAMYDPAGRHCLWHLVYSGAHTAGNEPYFWIVQFDSSAADSATETPPKALAVVVDTNPLDNLDRSDNLNPSEFKTEMKKEVEALGVSPHQVLDKAHRQLLDEAVDQVLAELGPLTRPLLGYVMSDRVLTNPPLRLDEENGVLNGAFWTVAPVDDSGELYVFRSQPGFSPALAQGLKTGDEITVSNDQKTRTVFCRTASAFLNAR